MELVIKNLSKEYGNGVKALQNVSLNIGRGMFGLLGQNGAGKSTLMRTIATLQDADSGSITFGNTDVAKDPDSLRRILGYLPQDFGVYPSVTAEELLNHIAYLKGITDKKQRRGQVEELLQKVNLYEHRKKKLEQYSGGMKQRFGIAQALLGNPELIIADEPTAGLDPMERNRFYNLLAELGEQAVIILSTHIVEDVSTLCDHMAVIGNGEVLFHGTPKSFEASLEGKLWEAQIASNELQQYQEKYFIIANRFHFGKLLITVFAESRPSSDFSAKVPSIEDAYFRLLEKEHEPVTA